MNNRSRRASMPRRKTSSSSSGNKPATSSSRSRRRRKLTVLPDLPEEIIPDILIWLPGNFLQSTITHVCDAWSKIITHPNFVDNHPRHLLNSTSGLIIQAHEKPYRVQYFQIDSGKVGVTDLFLELPGRATARCEGALLVHWKGDGQHRLIVADCIDMRVHDIPPPLVPKLPGNGPPASAVRLDQFRIARIPGTGEVKIVCQCRSKEYVRPARYYYWMVTTLLDTNDNSWRRIELSEEITCSSVGDAISAGGVIYIFIKDNNSCYVYAIDLCTEAVYKIQASFLHPAGENKFRDVCAIAAWEGKLCCFQNLENRIIGYRLDLDKGGWVEVDHFGNVIRRKIQQDGSEPIVWLDSDDGKMVIAKSFKRNFKSYALVAYNMRTGRRKKIKGVLLSSSFVLLPHSL